MHSLVEDTVLACGDLRLTLAEFGIARIDVASSEGWEPVFRGSKGTEFHTTVGGASGCVDEIIEIEDGGWTVRLRAQAEFWNAEGIITLTPSGLRRKQTYRFTQDAGMECAVGGGFVLADEPSLRYTYPIRVFGIPPTQIAERICTDVAWALPLPAHLITTDRWVAMYGVDRHHSGGTLVVTPFVGGVRVGVQIPDTTAQPQSVDPTRIATLMENNQPATQRFHVGEEVAIHEVIAFKRVGERDPLLEAVMLAADALIPEPRIPHDLEKVADGIVGFYDHCELWEENALGDGRGWFRSMWFHTDGAEPRRTNSFDLGWGEGHACETMAAATLFHARTGDRRLFRYTDEMTRNIPCFAARGAFYDRSEDGRLSDFAKADIIWTHSLGHLGLRLLQAFSDGEAGASPESRAMWLETAKTIVEFLSRSQRENGDLPDCFWGGVEATDLPSGRVAARAITCGLFTLYAEIAGKDEYVDRAMALFRAVAPEIAAYRFQNQMLDSRLQVQPITDGEGSCYVLEGLVPLYERSHDRDLLTACEQTTAVALCWTYFYDVPNAYRGIARGGQVCRMPDFPLLFPGGTAKAVEPLLRLSRLTGETFYRRMAGELVSFIASYQVDRPNVPWHGGIIHAIDQHSGRVWGPDREGQIDSAMSTATTLGAIEFWLRDAR